MSDRYLVSVIIPTYNLVEYLTKALNSIPVRNDIEVIVVDDGSTDNTKEVLETYWSKEVPSGWRYILADHAGYGAAMNHGYEVAQGTYIHELDVDDYLITDKYVDALRKLRSVNGTDIMYIDGITNEGIVYKITQANKHYFCAPWFRFIKRKFLGSTRMREDVVQPDWFLNEELQKKPHHEVYSDITAYHYNYPREGSITWNVINGYL